MKRILLFINLSIFLSVNVLATSPEHQIEQDDQAWTFEEELSAHKLFVFESSNKIINMVQKLADSETYHEEYYKKLVSLQNGLLDYWSQFIEDLDDADIAQYTDQIVEDSNDVIALLSQLGNVISAYETEAPRSEF